MTSKIKCDNTSFIHYYLCPYLPLTAGNDTLSLSLLKFKQRIQPDLDAWIDCSIQLLASLPFSPHTIILRALRHEELSPRMEFPSALDLLGRSLAGRLGCRYLPTLLTKTRTTLPGKHLTRPQRRSQLLDVYRFAANLPDPAAAPSTTPPITPSTPFLLIDDILTTGATMRALIRTLRDRCPDCPIKTFTLTRADYQGSALSLAVDSKIGSVETLKSRLFAKTV